MVLVEAVQRWHAEGKLNAEYGKLEEILTARTFTRDQVRFCFENMLPGIALLCAMETNTLKLETFRKRLESLFADEVQIVESCASIVTMMDKSEPELLEEFKRTVENRLWQRGQRDEDGTS